MAGEWRRDPFLHRVPGDAMSETQSLFVGVVAIISKDADQVTGA